MADLFKAKIRNIGTSAGVLIPQDKLIDAGLRIGDEVELSVLSHKKDLSGFGIAKKFKVEFKRDKKIRVF